MTTDAMGFLESVDAQYQQVSVDPLRLLDCRIAEVVFGWMDIHIGYEDDLCRSSWADWKGSTPIQQHLQVPNYSTNAAHMVRILTAWNDDVEITRAGGRWRVQFWYKSQSAATMSYATMAEAVCRARLAVEELTPSRMAPLL